MKFVTGAVADADVILYVTDTVERGERSAEIIDRIRQSGVPAIVVINKIDLTTPEALEALVDKWQGELPEARIVPASAKENFNIEGLFKTILDLLPEGPAFYPKDTLTDKTLRFFASEIIREKILRFYDKEIPYCCEIEIESYKEEPAIDRIAATIYVARDSQKGILIGHKGEKLKRVGQAQKSRIVMNAHTINQGRFPDTSNGRDTDFFFMREDDPERAAETIVRLVKERLPRAYRESPDRIQVLTPMQRGVVGAANLNLLLQQALNPSGPSLNRGGYTYRQGDRVMQQRNNYAKDVFNGDLGYIREVDTEGRTLKVDFDGKWVEYDVTELDELTLAYATTIHKAQGSEYPIVVMPVLMTHYVMLQRNLIYTGITRAKKICVLIGATKALAYAVHNMSVLKRNTSLRERLNPSLTTDGKLRG